MREDTQEFELIILIGSFMFQTLKLSGNEMFFFSRKFAKKIKKINKIPFV